MNIQIKSRLAAVVLFEHDSEKNSIRLTLELAIKSGAYLSDADLSGANLKNKEKLVGYRPIFQIGPIGSRSDVLVAYITDQGLRLDAGCQRQITRKVFEDRLNELHGENDHAKEYRAALALIDAHAEIWAPKEGAPAVESESATEEA